MGVRSCNKCQWWQPGQRGRYADGAFWPELWQLPEDAKFSEHGECRATPPEGWRRTHADDWCRAFFPALGEGA